MIRFKQDCDGYKAGEVVTLEGGVEDAYVNYRGAAEFVKPDEPETKGTDAPPVDKMMHPPKAGKSREGQVKVK